MGRKTPKTNQAVQVPKDGPVLWFLNGSNDGDDVRHTCGVKESLQLLALAKCDNEELEGLGASPSNVLWRILTSSDQIRPQLRALQAYRSKLLHLQSNGEIWNEQELVGTYRLLLEWCLSNDIPTPLRRAILSNLDTLDSIIELEAYRIREQVISSLLDEQRWSNQLGTLFEMLSYQPMLTIIVRDSEKPVKTLVLLVKEADDLQAILEEKSFYNQANRERPQNMTSQIVVAAMEKCAFIANSLKLFLNPFMSSMKEPAIDLAQLMETLQVFLWRALTCRGMPADELNAIGVTHGQSLLFDWKYTKETATSSTMVADKAVDKVEEIMKDTLLPQLNKLAAIQGITATLPNDVLISHSPPIFSEPFAAYFLEQCRGATGATVRLSALRTLHTLINRCLAIMSTSGFGERHLCYVSQIADGSLEVVLQAWESPPGRQVATAVPGLFRSLLALMRKIDFSNGSNTIRLNALVERILDLPPNRKVSAHSLVYSLH